MGREGRLFRPYHPKKIIFGERGIVHSQCTTPSRGSGGTEAIEPLQYDHRELFEGRGIGVMLHFMDGTIIGVNAPACELIGAKNEALIGTNVSSIMTRVG